MRTHKQNPERKRNTKIKPKRKKKKEKKEKKEKKRKKKKKKEKKRKKGAGYIDHSPWTRKHASP